MAFEERKEGLARRVGQVASELPKWFVQVAANPVFYARLHPTEASAQLADMAGQSGEFVESGLVVYLACEQALPVWLAERGVPGFFESREVGS